jgi:signal transduction histidine kinase
VETGLSHLNDEQFRAIRFDVVSRLADDLAHEIRNPLNAIVINLEVLRARLKRGDGTAALDRTDVIEHEARKLHLLVDCLLQLLRPDRSDSVNSDLGQVLDDVLPLIEAQVSLARNAFHSHCAATALVPVPAVLLRFALLEVMTAVHDSLGERSGEFSIDCMPVADHVHVRIEAASADPVVANPAFGGFAFATALLQPFGGSLLGDRHSVTLVLPRTIAP